MGTFFVKFGVVVVVGWESSGGIRCEVALGGFVGFVSWSGEFVRVFWGSKISEVLGVGIILE